MRCRKSAFEGDIDNGKLLAQLKAEFSHGSNISIEVCKLRQYAINENYSFGTRSLAAQLYARTGQPLVLSSSLPSALLCGTILECSNSDLRALCEWVCTESFVVDIRVCRAVLTTLQRLTKKKIRDDVPLECLSKCLNVLFRNLLSQCETSDEIRAIGTLLCLQRMYGIAASEQFELLSSFPTTVKQKFALLSFVIPALSADELQSVEYLLCDQLWLSQRTQPSASVTGDCALSWALASLRLSNSMFPSFLINCLSSSRKIRRLSCSRFWMSRFATRNELLPLLRSIKDELAQGIKEPRDEWPLCAAELRELTCIDYTWRWEEDEEVWSRNDCFTYAWIIVFSVLRRRTLERSRTQRRSKQKANIGISEVDEEMLRNCLMNSQSIIRLEAFNTSMDLLDRNCGDIENSDFVKRILESVTHFVVDNLNTDDGCLRNEVVGRFRPDWLTANHYLSNALIDGIDERMSPQRIVTSLSSMKSSGFEIDKAVTRIFPLVLHEDTSVRQKAVELLSDEFIENELISRLEEELLASFYTQERISRIDVLCQLLSKYQPVKMILQRVLAVNNDCIIGVWKCVHTLLDLHHELCTQYSNLIDKCIEWNERKMCASGSTKAGMCSSLVELSARLNAHQSDHLFIDSQQIDNLNDYYYTLWVSSELLTLLCKYGGLSRELAEKAYTSVWNVLMRSRHKGVLDNCADCFEQMTLSFIGTQLYSSLPAIFLEKTKQLFADDSVTTRNLAFCRIFSSLSLSCGYDHCVHSLIAYLISYTHSNKSRIAIRALKALRFILNSATIDLFTFHSTIFAMLLNVFRDGEWAVRSAASHCFAVLVNRMIDDGGYGYPLYTFLVTQPQIWNLIKKEILQLNANDICLVLVLSLLEKLRIVNNSLYTAAQLNDIAVVNTRLSDLLFSSTNIRIGRTLVDCLVNLCASPGCLHMKLRKFLLREHIPANLRCAIEYAVDKVKGEEHRLEEPMFDGTLENALQVGNGHVIVEALNVLYDLKKGRTDAESDRCFHPILESLCIDALSALELKRLRAAHVFALIAPFALRCSSALRIRYFCYGCALLMDEMERVRCIESFCSARLRSRSKVLSSISSAVAIQRLIREMVYSGESIDGLIIAWRQWSAKTYAKRRRYNRYFEDIYVEKCLLTACQKSDN